MRQKCEVNIKLLEQTMDLSCSEMMNILSMKNVLKVLIT